MELSNMMTFDNFAIIVAVWLVTGCALIFNLNIWSIARLLNAIEKAGWVTTAAVMSLVVILLWPIAPLLMWPVAKYVMKRQDEDMEELKEALRKVREGSFN